MKRHSIIRLFESRKAHLDDRLKRDYVRNGIVTIPCRISDYSDVISTYSVKDYESLNEDFSEYVKSAAEMTPDEYPLVLNIIGDCLSQEDKDVIEDTIRDDFAYDLGMVEKTERRHTHSFSFMFIGLLLSGILLAVTETMAEVPREVFYILFWFMGDTLCDYVFVTGYELRRDRILAGRLASIKVIFSETFEKPDYTKKDTDKLYSEIEKEVIETIQEEQK